MLKFSTNAKFQHNISKIMTDKKTKFSKIFVFTFDTYNYIYYRIMILYAFQTLYYYRYIYMCSV